MALARPWVVKDKKEYYMWFSSKNNWLKKSNYKIYLAHSKDGIKWKRLDKNSVIKKNKKGWDSQMNEYPSVIEFNNKMVMFYNGNNFGENGFGLAISEKIYK